MALNFLRSILIIIVSYCCSGYSADRQGLLASQGRSEFCEMRKHAEYFKNLAYEPTNHLSFDNQGGLFNGGVCWWHSLFQRAALYVTVYRPELEKPNELEAKKIVHLIAAGTKVVEIPGYKNLNEFSRDWSELIQAKLEEWQLVDGFLKFAWIKGLSGSTDIKPKKLKAKWDYFYEKVEEEENIEWAMIQLKGISSHSMLMLSIAKSETEYNVNYLDSNYVGTTQLDTYYVGQRSVFSIYGPFVPYKGRRSDFKKFKKAAERYCSGKEKVKSLISEDLRFYPLNNDLE